MGNGLAEQAPGKILLIRFSSAGDLVLLSALIRVLRKTWAHADIDMVTRKDLAILVEENPHLSTIHTVEREAGLGAIKALASKLRHSQYDLVIDAHGSGRSRIIRRLIRPSCIAKISKFSWRRYLRIFLKLNLLAHRKKLLESYFEPVQGMGIAYDGQGSEFFVSDARASRVRGLVARKFPRGEVLVGISPTASFRKKAFPMPKFKRICGAILENPACGIILFGGPDEPKLVLEKHQDRVLDLQGQTDLQESAFAAGLCRLVLSNDSVMMHLAEAMGVDAYGVFGPTTRDFGYFPHRPGSHVFEARVWCRPCSKNGSGFCFRFHRHCFRRIDEDEIIRAIRDRVSETTPQPN